MDRSGMNFENWMIVALMEMTQARPAGDGRNGCPGYRDVLTRAEPYRGHGRPSGLVSNVIVD
jgi:hypothetical protein